MSGPRRRIAVKANIDVAGHVSHAGAPALLDTPPVQADAPVVARLRATNADMFPVPEMSELAFSGIGLNARFGTPRNLRAPDRVPGGSSSGPAAAVASGAADIGLGTDTSGSVRVPAAAQGLVGFRPSIGRWPGGGIVPLAPGLDTPGAIARDVAGCAWADAAVTGDAPAEARARKLIVPTDLWPRDGDEATHARFARRVDCLRASGWTVETCALPALSQAGGLFARYGTPVMAAAVDLAARIAVVDPDVRHRLVTARVPDAAGLRVLRSARTRARADLAGFLGDALVLHPALPGPAPTLAEVTTRESFARANARILSLTMPSAWLGLPSLALPVVGPPEDPGLLLSGAPGCDSIVLGAGIALEALFSRDLR